MKAKAREALKPPAWLPWIGATTIGSGLGMTLSTYLVSHTRSFGPVLAGLLNVILYGTVIGIVLGSAQWAVMPRGLVPLQAWILATVAGEALGLATASAAAEALGNALDPATPIILGQVEAIAAGSAILGLGIGIGQWLVFQPRLSLGPAWIAASSAGMTLGGAAAAVLVGLWQLPLLEAAPSATVGASLGFGMGLVQGVVLWLHPRLSK